MLLCFMDSFTILHFIRLGYKKQINLFYGKSSMKIPSICVLFHCQQLEFDQLFKYIVGILSVNLQLS